MKRALLSLGTNLGDREANLKFALGAIANLPGTRLLAESELYETEPVGFLDQGLFINMVIKIETDMSAMQLLGACLGIEAALGRERSFKNAPRLIDIDLLLYEDEKYDTKALELPHPRMHERAFVLVPLKDIYPDLQVFSYSFLEDFKKLDKSGVRLYIKKNI